MKSKTDKYSFLKLVSLKNKSSVEGRSDDRISKEPSVQFEMFPNGGGSSSIIIFVQPSCVDFKSMMAKLSRVHVHMIFDIRESPYFNFGDMTRDKVFEIIDKERMDYLNIHKWMRLINVNTVKEYFSIIDKDERLDIDTSRELKKSIEEKAIVVFSDTMPESDELVSCFQRILKKEKVDYTAHYYHN